jgi:hypothetical protein
MRVGLRVKFGFRVRDRVELVRVKVKVRVRIRRRPNTVGARGRNWFSDVT